MLLCHSKCSLKLSSALPSQDTELKAAALSTMDFMLKMLIISKCSEVFNK
jgi:hypothetical protein